MVNEVNKIVRNTLLSGGDGIFLPGIGSLAVERRAAARSSRKTLEHPRKVVVFKEQKSGVSLIDEIAALGIDTEQAHEIYNDWRVQTFSDGVLRIDGVGTLQDNVFIADKAFSVQLNPQSSPVRIKPKPDKLIYIFAVLCCLFAFCVAWYVWDSNSEKPEHTRVSANIESEVAAPAVSEEPATVEAVAEQPAEQQKGVETAKREPADKQTVLRSVSGHSYLVLGIFSTEENAFKAVQNAGRTYPYADCRVYRYSDKFMVSLFESATAGECVEYKRTVDAFFPDLWIYTKR